MKCSQTSLLTLLALAMMSPLRTVCEWTPACPDNLAPTQQIWCEAAINTSTSAILTPNTNEQEATKIVLFNASTYNQCIVNKFSKKYFCPYRLHELSGRHGEQLLARVSRLARAYRKIHIVGDSVSHELADALSCLLETSHGPGKSLVPPGFVSFHHFKTTSFNFVSKSKSVGRRDAVVLNEGIWYNFEGGIGAMRLRRQLGQLRHNLRMRKNAVRTWVWMESPAQHFHTATGDYPHAQLKERSNQCVSLKDESATHTRGFNFRNRVAQSELLKSLPIVRVLRAFSATSPLYFEHPSAALSFTVPIEYREQVLESLGRATIARLSSTLKRIRAKNQSSMSPDYRGLYEKFNLEIEIASTEGVLEYIGLYDDDLLKNVRLMLLYRSTTPTRAVLQASKSSDFFTANGRVDGLAPRQDNNSEAWCSRIFEYTRAEALVDHPTSHRRTKHIEIRREFIKYHIEHETVKIERVSTKDQLVDIMTKPLRQDIHNYLVQMILHG
ncbi:hypothetical protein NFJ02_32g81570 [Pycnococcus provasolii]